MSQFEIWCRGGRDSPLSHSSAVSGDYARQAEMLAVGNVANLQRGIEAIEARQVISRAAVHAASACDWGCKTKGSVKLPAAVGVKQEPTETIKLAQEIKHV